MLAQQFQQLGFSENEASIYIALAEMGKSSASSVAKRCELPRSTAYSVLESLAKRGVVSSEQQASTTLFCAKEPSALSRMIQKEREESKLSFETKEQAANDLIQLVQPYFKGENYSVPRIQFYEGQHNVETMLYENCIYWQESLAKSGDSWWGYQDHGFVEQYRTWLEYYWSIALPNENAFLFSNQSEVEKKLEGQVPRRNIKLVPKDMQFSSSIWVIGEYVVTIMSRQKPHYAFQLKDTVFAKNQRQVFQLLWKSRD